MSLPSPRRPASSLADRRGVTTLGAAAGGVVLFGALALATDAGTWQAARRGAQNAADAGAATAALTLAMSSTTAARDAARDIAARNGFTHADGGATAVTVNIPPTTGRLAGQPNAVEVVVRQRQSMGAAGLFLAEPPTVQARSVALLQDASNVCVLALSGQVWAGGNVDVRTPNCVIASNRRASPSIEIVGDSLDVRAFTLSAVASCLNCDSSRVTLTQRFGEWQLPVTNPYAHLDSKLLPGASAPCHANLNQDPLPSFEDSGRVICGTFQSAGTGAHRQLGPGAHYIRDGALRVQGNARLTGHGVAIVFLGTPTNETIRINANSIVDLRAAANARDPDYNGVLFYVRQAVGSVSNPEVRLNGGTSMSLVGGLYFPQSHVQVNGNAAVLACSVLVASSVTFVGNADVTQCASVGTAVPRTRIVRTME